MAGDWIKIERDLPHKPEVMQLAEILGVDELQVVGHLVLFWSWCDANMSLDCPDVSGTKRGLDRASCRDGMVDAMVSVGWLEIFEEDGQERYRIPNFERHLSKSAKTRANEQRKKQRQRICPDGIGTNVPMDGGTKPGPEKRREDKSINKTQSDRFTESDEETANYIWDQIHQSFPSQRKPNLQSWADTIRLMRERDELADAEIRRVFDWAHEDSFWRPNILSPKKLREKWNVLEARADTPAPKPEIKPGTPEWSARSIKWLEHVREWQAMANRGEITDAEFNRRVAEAAARAPE